MSLTNEQMQVVDRVLPFAILISDWSRLKAEFLNLHNPRGIYPSVILSEIIIQSNWMLHPIAQTEITIRSARKESHRYSNNLALLPVNNGWRGKSNEFDGVEYRAYKDWQVFAIDYSDYLTFTREFDDLLCEHSPERQLEAWSLTKTDETWYDQSKNLLRECQEYISSGQRERIKSR